MPAVSKAQFRFMKAIASGKRRKKGLSRKDAAEFISGQTMKKLPERAKKKKK